MDNRMRAEMYKELADINKFKKKAPDTTSISGYDPLEQAISLIYSFYKKTPRGSVVSISKNKRFARIEVTCMEDANDLSVLLNALNLRRKSLRNVSGPAWVGASYRFKDQRGPMDLKNGTYPGITYYINYEDLLKVSEKLR